MVVEIIGLLASCFVLLSFVFKNTKKIRVINIVGATLFVIYGAFSGALSVWLLNGILIGVHIYHLIKINKEEN